MARNFNIEEHKAGLTLIVKPVDDPERPVDAEQFLQAATKWLASLTSFASDSGLEIRWEIAELKRSSALLEVIPVDVRTGIIAASVARNWKKVVRQIEETGTPPNEVRPETLRDIERFTSEGNNLAMVVSAGDERETQPITVATQKRMKEAVAALPSQEYSQEGTLRGNLAVLNSWNQDERWFRLRVPLAPDKQIRCVYKDESLIGALGDTFEKLVDVTGLMHYRKTEVWPHMVQVSSIKPVHSSSLDFFLSKMRPFNIPAEMDSVSYIRSIRDGE
jgi:hypothetical protein